jgi:transcriptional regulator with XRE-family HTH domain
MNKQEQLSQIRMRKVGLLIYDARAARRRSVEETAAAVAISGEQLQAFEKGEQAPSLPMLEALAFYLEVPIDQFWSVHSLSEAVEEDPIQQKERLRQLRDRIIGATLRMHRTQLNFSLREVSSATSISEEQLKKYETGELAVTLPELELLAKTYDTRIEEFFDQKGPIGKRRAEQTAIRQFLELPPQLQEFVCRPVNKPYLVLASRLSELSVEKLRAVAEGLLEITY